MVLAPLLFFFNEELPFEVFAFLVRQRLILINVYVAAVMHGLRTMDVLLDILKPGQIRGCDRRMACE